MKVLLTGATGFVGQEVLQCLMDEGHDVTVLARHRLDGIPEGCKVLRGSLANAGSIPMPPLDAVIHLVGIIAEVGQNTFDSVHRQGTENILAAAKSAGVRRFIHMSALGTRINAVSRYHQSKWAGEEAVRQSGLDATIFRPSIIYGVRDQFVNQFERMSRFLPVLPVMGNGQGTFQPISVECVAQVFVKALNKPETIGKTYDLVGPDILTLPQILDAIMSVKRRHRFKIRVPTPMARIMAAAFETVCPKLGMVPPLNRDQLLMLNEQNIGNPVPANEVFSFDPVPFKVGLEQMFSKRV